MICTTNRDSTQTPTLNSLSRASGRASGRAFGRASVQLRALILCAFAVCVFASPAKAQDPAAAPAPGDQAQASGQPAQPGLPAVPPPGTTENPEKIFSGFVDPFDYAPSGRRDPFVQPIPDKPMEQGNVAGPLLPLQKFELGQLRLVGIIWDVKRPKAMIKDPNGITHVVGPNTKVGPKNGYIAVIREGEMVVVETQDQDGRLVSSAQVVKIAK